MKLILHANIFHKIPEYEYNMTSMLINALDIEYERDMRLSYNYIIMYLGQRDLLFPRQYVDLDKIPKGSLIFRPFKNERHANLLVDIFDEEYDLTDSLTIEEEERNDRKLYSGYFTKDGVKINKSYVYKCPSPAFLKSYMVAKMVLDKNEYIDFSTNLKLLLNRGKVHV